MLNYKNQKKSFILYRSSFIKNLSSFIVHPSSKSAFTLMELLIVISIIAILVVAIIILLNPFKQIQKSWDGKRKHELTQLNKVLEDYYNDKQCYPEPNEVCYNSYATLADGTYTCNICGNESDPTNFASFSPYVSELLCDPQHPSKQYLYQVDDVDCPTWYRIYTTLSITTDPLIVSVGCSGGCGPSSNFIYNYGVTSPNIGLEKNNNLCRLASKLYVNPDSNPNCDVCGSDTDQGPPPGPYNKCKADLPDEIYYTDFGDCTITCTKD
ncbi:MAG: prepilin-type N-terminal cleavage/methylation domain-containing protein [bacterium]|nr:prepilin-type N-terminal cleavage/methylation domain-containing protein [bacterium]